MNSKIVPPINNSMTTINLSPDSNSQPDLYRVDDFERLDTDKTIPGEIERLPQHNEPNPMENGSPIIVQFRLQFLKQLLMIGGWTVAVLLTFRLIAIPLLAAGNSPVALILAIAAGTFLVLCGIGAVIRELHR